MTHELKPLPTEEQVSAADSQKVRNAARLATIILGAAAVVTVFYLFLAWQLGAWQLYVLAGVIAAFAVVNFVALQTIRSGRIETGSWMIMIGMMVVFPVAVLLVSDVGLIFGLIVVILTFVVANQTLPTKSARLALIAGLGVGILTAALDLLTLEYRLFVPIIQTFIPAVAGAIVLVVGIFVARQAWISNNIRSRFLTFSIGLTITAVAVIAYASINSLLSAGEQAQETSSAVLREQAQEEIAHQSVTVSKENELILQGISQDAKDIARQATYIFEKPSAFNVEENWIADEHMLLGGLGQYINRPDDVSTVFVPNTVKITDSIKNQLELIAFLDIAFVPVYESDPNSVAIYYIGKEDITWLHPNISLGDIVPPDYPATQDIFYTIGTPENNPEREVVWTSVYDDPAGQGLLVSAIAPVYAFDRFKGVIGIDVSLAGLTSAIEQAEQAAGGYSLLLDTDGRTLALPEQGYVDFYGRERQEGEFGSDFVASAQPEFASVISDMLLGQTDFQSVEVNGKELYISYTTMESTGWHVASVVAAEEVLAPATALQTQLEDLSNSLIFGRILPVGVIFIVMVVLASIFFTNLLIRPIEQLTESASKIGLGEWDTHLPESEMREINGLSTTLGAMAAQLKDTLGSLEQRVADRTKALATSAEVTRRLSTVTDPVQLASEVVNEVRAAFDYYYAQIYLLDEAGENLVIAGGTGEAGASMMASRHSLPKGRGLVGRAADANVSVLVPDTTQEEGWLPNELLPETKAETAIPIAIGSQVLGVLDVQHNLVNGLTADDVVLLESLAGQVAITLQNARSYEQSRSQAEMESLVNVIGQKIQRTTTMEETLQTAIRELGIAIGASRVRAKLAPAASAVATEPIAPPEPVTVVAGEDNTSETETTPAD